MEKIEESGDEKLETIWKQILNSTKSGSFHIEILNSTIDYKWKMKIYRSNDMINHFSLISLSLISDLKIIFYFMKASLNLFKCFTISLMIESLKIVLTWNSYSFTSNSTNLDIIISIKLLKV